MSQTPKKAEKLTTDQAIRRLFSKPVVEGVKREIAETDVIPERRSKPSMKRD